MPRGNPGQKRGARVSDDDWQRWLEAFRLHPRSPTRVSEVMGCPVGKAKRAFNRGWPAEGKPPIRDVLDDERRRARIIAAGGDPDVEENLSGIPADRNAVNALVRREQARLELARRDAQTRQEESELVQITRHNSIALAGVTAQLLQTGLKLGAKLSEQLDKADLDLRESYMVLRQTAAVVRLNNEASKMAMQMERLLVGAPDTDEEGNPVTGDKLTAEQAARWIELSAMALRRAEARGYLPKQVIDAEATAPAVLGTGSR